MNKNAEFKDYFKILWHKKILIIIVMCSCMFIAGLINVLKPSKYETESTILISCPYKPDSVNLPNAPYVQSLYADLFNNKNFRNNVIDKINIKYTQPNLTVENLEQMARLKLFSKSNIIKIRVEGDRLELLVDLAKIVSGCYVDQFNYMQDTEFLKSKNAVEADLDYLQKKLNSIDEEIKELGMDINYQFVQQQLSQFGSQLATYENQLRDRKTYLTGVNTRIQELESQLKKEEESQVSRPNVIDSLGSQLNSSYVDKKNKDAEYEDMGNDISKLKDEVNDLNDWLVYYNNENRKLENERTLVYNELNNFKNTAYQIMITAKSNKLNAEIFDLPGGEPKKIKSNLKSSLAFSGIGSLMLVVLFIWICLV